MQYWPKLPDGYRTISWDVGSTVSGSCGSTVFSGWQPPTFGPYVPPPCTRVPPDPSRQLATRVPSFDLSVYAKSVFLDMNEKYKLYWSLDLTNRVIHGAVEVKTTGWIGFGITNNGMEGADVFIGWIDENGVPQFADRFAEMKAFPPADQLQDYYDITATEIPENSNNPFPPWAVYVIGVVSGVVLLLAAVFVFRYVRSRQSVSYTNLKETEPVYTKQNDVPL